MTEQRAKPHLPRMESPPPALIPLLYFGFAHLSLIVALTVVTIDNAGFAGFFYHPRGLAVVHLITLGWISATIVGALYVVGPLALRISISSGRLDLVAFLLFTLGTIGMAGHFWIGEYSGIVWSAGILIVSLAIVASKVVPGLMAAPIGGAVKMHIGLAFLNLFGAALFGMLLGINRQAPFLAGDPLSRVYAHAHLAALGWAIMMVIGVGYRLLPMLLPSAVPGGKLLHAGGILLEIGVLGLFWSLLAGSRLLPLFALIAMAAIAAFLRQVIWMRRNRRKPPPGLRFPDYGVLHAMQAIAYGGVGAVIGCALAVMPRTEATLRYAAVYGVIGLVAFLSQIVIGVEARILPVFVAIRSSLGRSRRRAARRGADGCVRALNPHGLIDRRFQATTFYCWTIGLPLLAIGVGVSGTRLVTAGAALLLIGSMLAAINVVLIVR